MTPAARSVRTRSYLGLLCELDDDGCDHPEVFEPYHMAEYTMSEYLHTNLYSRGPLAELRHRAETALDELLEDSNGGNETDESLRVVLGELGGEDITAERLIVGPTRTVLTLRDTASLCWIELTDEGSVRRLSIVAALVADELPTICARLLGRLLPKQLEADDGRLVVRSFRDGLLTLCEREGTSAKSGAPESDPERRTARLNFDLRNPYLGREEPTVGLVVCGSANISPDAHEYMGPVEIRRTGSWRTGGGLAIANALKGDESFRGGLPRLFDPSSAAASGISGVLKEYRTFLLNVILQKSGWESVALRVGEDLRRYEVSRLRSRLTHERRQRRASATKAALLEGRVRKLEALTTSVQSKLRATDSPLDSSGRDTLGARRV